MNCCICNKPIKGHGNNAEPVKKGICCDKCNNKFVILARMLDIEMISYKERKNRLKEIKNAAMKEGEQ